MPVPRDRTDEAYFRPLEKLLLDLKTKLILGLIHYTDGFVGTRERIDAAKKFIPSFGIATECGFGRRKPETLNGLLDIHVQGHDYLSSI